ncbi:MAG TPA: CoA transferase, partial [Puia sp.]|nr:CoA transferase [Puia sp.]
PDLAKAISSEELAAYRQEQAFSHRDEIKEVLTRELAKHPTAYWLERLHAEDMWAMEVLDWKRLAAHPGYQVLEMEQPIDTGEGRTMITTRCPIRIDGRRLYSPRPAPSLGQNNTEIGMELLK